MGELGPLPLLSSVMSTLNPSTFTENLLAPRTEGRWYERPILSTRRIPLPERKYIPRIDRRLILRTRRRLESSRRTNGPRNVLNKREIVAARTTHIDRYPQIDIGGGKSVVVKSAVIAKPDIKSDIGLN